MIIINEIKIIKTHLTEEKIKARRSKITCPESLNRRRCRGYWGRWEGGTQGWCHVTIPTDKHSTQCRKSFISNVKGG